jgi:prephenate dehydrogenase
MKKPVIVIGIGEMSGVFTRALLRSGYPIYPLTREMSMGEMAKTINNFTMVLVAVGEKDLDPVLSQLPEIWKDKVIDLKTTWASVYLIFLMLA